MSSKDKRRERRRAAAHRLEAGTDPYVREIPRPSVVEGGRLRVVDFFSPLPPFSLERYDLRVEQLSDVIALPVAGTRKTREVTGAVYDRNGDLVPETQRSTRRGSWGSDETHLDDLPRAEALRLGGRTLFAGRIVHHFGHILLETLTRAWPEIDYSAYDRLLLYPNGSVNRAGKPLPGVLQTLLSAAGIPLGKVMVIGRKPLAIEHLDVPGAPFRMALSADPRFLLPFDRIARRVAAERGPAGMAELPARIYLSRARLGEDKRRATNEAELESIFTSRGFAVVHPQLLPFDEQVALCRHADAIAGCDGSALHLAAFARPGTKLLGVDTRAVANQFVIDQARELDALHVWGTAQDISSRLDTWTADVTRIANAVDLLLEEPVGARAAQGPTDNLLP